ncbi:unnamed protein product, partial [Brenthis ino]
MSVLSKGMKFDCDRKFLTFFKKYQRDKRQLFTKRSSISSQDKQVAHRNINRKKFKYYTVLYCCKYGGHEYESQSNGERKRGTRKMGCKAKVRATVDKTGRHLVIRKADLIHTGHDDLEEYFDTLPENKRLSDQTTQYVLDTMKFDPKKAKLFDYLETKKNVQWDSKDLANLKRRHEPTKNGNDYVEFTKILKNEEMRKAMSKWSDIVFWDSTYRLLNNNFVLSLFHVEDSNGFTRTVGVGLLANEEAETFKWLLTCFREANPEACLKIRSIMTDKDPSERAALREIFPEVNLLICSFHVQQIFHRQITVGKRGVTSEEKDDLLLILRKLVYSESEEDYDETYTEFCEVAPEEVIDYYNTNWHSIKDEWVLYRMNAHGNLNNNTNNRAESTHAKGKQIVPLHSSLVEFGKNIFVFFRAQARQIKIKSGKLMTTKSAEAFTTADEKNYCELLTPKAFAELQPELLEYPDVQIMSSNVAQKECSFELNGRTITSSLTKCKCLKNRSMFLPCKHVFATRDFFEQPLFDKTLCAERWLRGYSVQCDTEISKLTHFPNCSQSSNGSVTQIRQSNEHVTLEKLAKKYDTSFNLLAHVGSLSANQNLQNKSDCLHDVMDLWAKGKNVRLSKITNNELNVIQCTLKLKSTNDKRRHLFCMKKTPREIQLSEKKIKILNRLLSLWKKNVPVIAKESDGDCSLNDSATLNTSEIKVDLTRLLCWHKSKRSTYIINSIEIKNMTDCVPAEQRMTCY